MRLTTRYPLTIVAIALVAAALTGAIAYHISKSQLMLTAEQQAEEILGSRKAALHHYLESIRQDLSVMASNLTVQEAVRGFSSAWSRLEGAPQDALQGAYIHNNPFPPGSKEELVKANDGSSYSDVHGQFHPWFWQVLQERGYYDVFLFDTKGNLVYTVFKESDFATNMFDGDFRGTNLGRAYRTTAFNKSSGLEVFFDFERYEPSGNAPASFIASPIIDPAGDFIGVLAFQMPIGRINDIMQVTAGMGETGRVYLVGSDLLVRNDSRFASESEILRVSKPADIVSAAMEGNSGIRYLTNEAGDDLLVAYTSISFLGQAWAIVMERDLAEVLAPITEMRNVMLTSGIGIFFVVALIGLWLARRLSNPIVAMTGVMKRMAERDLDVDIPSLRSGDELGEMAQTLTVFRENSYQRKRAEEENEKNREILHAMADNLPEFISMTDKDGRYVFVNKHFEEWTCRNSDEVVGKSVFDLYPKEQAVEYDAFDQQAMAARDVISDEIVDTYPDGNVRTVIRTRFPVVSPNGEILGLGNINHDITDLKEAEKALRTANEELHDLNEQKNKFLGMAAHDLRNPLSAIRGMTQLILELDLEEEKKKEFIQSINQVSDQMLTLLNDLLDVSAIESGKFDLKLEKESLGELLRNRVELTAFDARTKGIDIAVDLEDVPAFEFDHARIGQVIDNLLTNAVKFSPPDTIINTSVTQQNASVLLVVEDHGQGIPKEELGKLFTAFEKLSPKPTGGERSSGLGLAIVKKIIDAHGGGIAVESVEGEGTKFTVSLPAEYSHAGTKT